MAKVKVRILYPTAFQALGYETRTLKEVKQGDKKVMAEVAGEQLTEIEVESADAETLIGAGHAEKLGK